MEEATKKEFEDLYILMTTANINLIKGFLTTTPNASGEDIIRALEMAKVYMPSYVIKLYDLMKKKQAKTTS